MDPLTDNSTQSIGTAVRDARGVVYVEFLLAFIPLFLLFLGICQLVFLTAARVVVSHAAVAAARSAIVVLEDQADDYGGAPLGSLSEGKETSPDVTPLLSQLGVKGGSSLLVDDRSRDSASLPASPEGPRMAAIRLAATVPLMMLAPSERAASAANDTLEHSLVSTAAGQMAFAFAYTRAAAAVTVHSDETSDTAATEPLNPKGLLTLRVTYLYNCGVPIVRALMCHTLTSILGNNSAESLRLRRAAKPSALQRWIGGSPTYAVISGQASLPNQGADYLAGGDST